jgi:hypothetical protein
VNKSENRTVIYFTDEQLSWLKKRSAQSGAPVCELVRRAVQTRMTERGADRIMFDHEDFPEDVLEEARKSEPETEQ